MLKRNLMLILLPALLIITSSCGSKETALQAGTEEMKKVTVMEVQSTSITRETELSGTLRPLEEALVSFEVSGQIASLYKQEGDSVKAGEPIAELDQERFRLQVEKAAAALEQARAALAEVERGSREEEIKQAEASLEKAKIAYEQARDHYERMKNLYDQGAVSKVDFENAEDRLALAEKDLQSAQQAHQLVMEGATNETREQIRASYQSALAAKSEAELQLQKATLSAPMNGTIMKKLVSNGELVQAGAPVYEIAATDRLKVVLPVPDKDIDHWKTGDKVTLRLYEEEKRGTVTKIYPSTNERTGTIGVEIVLPNTENRWFPGQVVTAVHRQEPADGIYVPASAVINEGEGNAYVFILEDKRAKKVKVDVGTLFEDKLEILSGLQAGDTLVVGGADRLFDGDPIEVVGGQ